MRAITVLPGKLNSARLEQVVEPSEAEGEILVRTLAVGICGTDLEIVQGRYGLAPSLSQRLIVGHEVLGEVLHAPSDSSFRIGDRVVGIVRRPDPIPCPSCAAGEWDMCRNGLYTECGIKSRHGFASDRFRIEPEFVVKVDPKLGYAAVLTEPASVIAKAWEQIERIGRRLADWQPQTVLVTGAGPVGLLAALLGSQRGLTVHVFDRATHGPKPLLVNELGGIYHSSPLANLQLKPDIVIECTGAASVIVDAINRTASAGIVCLAGISSGGHKIDIDVGLLNLTMVLENDVIFGSVNANRRHYEAAAHALSRANPLWLAKLITRRIAPADWNEAFQRRSDDIKVTIDFTL
ncbi:MAG: glucose 1-dehydrogenase [Pseudomonadota bacterium]